MSDIIDLDVLVPPDKKVSLGQHHYSVPGDMPMVTYLKVTRVSALQEGDDPVAALNSMVEALVELFCWRVADEDTAVRERVDTELRRLGLATITKLLGKIYPNDTDDAVAEGEQEAQAADPSPTTSTTSPSAG